MLDVPYTDLVSECERKFDAITITAEQAKTVEKLTSDQAVCRAWYPFRGGCVTASKFKAAAHTDITQPSVSLINLKQCATLIASGSQRKQPDGL